MAATGGERQGDHFGSESLVDSSRQDLMALYGAANLASVLTSVPSASAKVSTLAQALQYTLPCGITQWAGRC